jgi:4-aminobutyrate aminotransferase-like enzyme
VYRKVIVDVRGKGLMIGLEFASADLTKAIVVRAQELGVILSWSIYAGGTVRIAPPLNITQEEVNCGLGIIDQAIADVVSEGQHV